MTVMPQAKAGRADAPANVRVLLILVIAVLFLFGGITNLNDVLIPKLKGLFSLSYTQAMLVSLAVEGLGNEAPKAWGLLCTAIVGGAIVPLLTGAVADAAGLSASLVIPAVCYGVITMFGVYVLRVDVLAPSPPQS